MHENHCGQAEPPKDLIDDLKRCVLDYVRYLFTIGSSQRHTDGHEISLPSDLRSLCLVSKSWCFAATKRLYEHIVLSGDSQVIRFTCCLDFGASRHLQHMRQLSILETWSGGAHETTVRSILYGPSIPTDLNRRRLPEEQGGTDVSRFLRLLRCVPDSRLHTVRLLPATPLRTDCLEYLREHQRTLACLHINIPFLPWTAPLSFRELTVGFHTVLDKTRRLDALLDQMTYLAALTLAFWGGWTSDVHRYWLHWTDQTTRKVAPQQLAVVGSMPDTFWAAASERLDLSRLTSLTLVKCDFDVLGTLRVSIHSLIKLNVCFESSLGDIRLYVLQDVFNNNKKLEHVHLDIPDSQLEYSPSNDPYSIFYIGNEGMPFRLKQRAYLWPLRHEIRSLSLNDKGFLEHCADEDVRAAYGTRLNTFVLRELHEVCFHFRRLKQLGWNVFEPRTNPDMLDLMEPLKQLKDLRMFHAYQQYFTLVQDHHSCGCEDVVSHLHHFANQLFAQLHPHCPQLQVFVWGLCGGLFTPGGTPLGEEIHRSAPVRQLIFAKRTVVLPDNKLQITAIQVSRVWVRHEFPDLDLLQYDPGLSMADPGTQLLGW